MEELFEKLLNKHFDDDTLPTFYIECAQDMIKNYTGLENLDVSFNNATVTLAVYLFRSGGAFASSYREGERSITRGKDEIPPEIKAMLPYPKMKAW